MEEQIKKRKGKQARQIKFGGTELNFIKKEIFGRVLEALNVEGCYSKNVNYWFNELSTSPEDETAEF